MDSVSTNVEKLKDWLKVDLPCVPGKREFATGRYFITAIRDTKSMETAYSAFQTALIRRETVASLFVISEDVALPAASSAEDQFRQLAEMMVTISDISPDLLASGGRLGKTIELPCPVTNVMHAFDDFDAVAFCPQSNDIMDPLYDPMMAAPVPCVNFNSDIYAFSMFTRDYALKTKNAQIWQLDPFERQDLFAIVAKRWQQYALATIKGYMNITNLERCPVSLRGNDTIWYANHQDPAFAETTKSQYAHHMPSLYAPKIIEKWQNFFETGVLPHGSVEDITPFGMTCPFRASEARQ
ncbi:hypothetical protein [uncultured Agrobacterium sp.]|uniref:hypothetical protein n=1 Tax=uncultured Agrobacterium sp. TaxID=157277 RepID=UPI0025EF62D5|nr:hypothetical protein [uncultured Agrobacterium sp.]